MPISIVPRERIFCRLFNQDIDTIVEGTRALLDLTNDFRDIPRSSSGSSNWNTAVMRQHTRSSGR